MSVQTYAASVSVVLFLFSLLCFVYGAAPVGWICLAMILVANVVAWIDI